MAPKCFSYIILRLPVFHFYSLNFFSNKTKILLLYCVFSIINSSKSWTHSIGSTFSFCLMSEIKYKLNLIL